MGTRCWGNSRMALRVVTLAAIVAGFDCFTVAPTYCPNARSTLWGHSHMRGGGKPGSASSAVGKSAGNGPLILSSASSLFANTVTHPSRSSWGLDAVVGGQSERSRSGVTSMVMRSGGGHSGAAFVDSFEGSAKIIPRMKRPEEIRELLRICR